MSNRKQTKRALLTSITALVMCVVMLAGTTFAWFTDTATANVNKIQAGNLDVELYYASGTNASGTIWTKVDENTSLGWMQKTSAAGEVSMVTGADKPLWEPGCTFSLPQLKIVNNGNLDLKYKIIINGIRGDEGLNKVLDWTVTKNNNADSDTTTLDTEHELLAKTGDQTESADIFTISGHMDEKAGNDYQGLSIEGISITVVATQLASEYDSQNNTYDEDAVLPVSASAKGNLVVEQTAENTNATVKSEQILSDGVMSVTYPNGVVLNTTKVSTGDDSTKKTSVEQKLEYKDDTASDKLTEAKISIGSDKAVAQYELTLPVADTNEILVPVEINYTKNLTGVVVYHSGVALGTSETKKNTDGEYFTYDYSSGKLTLYLKHASPVDIVYNKPKQLPEDAKIVLTEEALKEAVGALHNGDYIALGANIATTEASGQITFTRAEGVAGDITATLDMNGCVFAGQIGGFSFENEGITVKVYGNEKAVAEFYKHEEGHLVNTFAVFNYTGKTVLEDGLFSSNNCTIGSYGGEIVVDGGKVEATGEGSVCLYAVNDGTVTINGGSFTSGTAGALMIVESTSKDPTVVINSGTFIAEGNAFVFEKTPTSGNKCKVTINGGNFTLNAEDGIVGWEGNGVTEEWAKQFVTITGGTFNVDPSDYVADGYEAVKNENTDTWTVSASVKS